MRGPFAVAERGLVAALCLALAGLIAFAFWPGLAGAWLNWDDHMNFTENPAYRGLSAETIAWAWTTYLVGVYQPVAWMLLGAQYLVSGMDPWGYHLASIAMHAAVAVVLLLVCIETGTRVRPDEREVARRRRILLTALAVALVMVHPLRVEVVAWVSCQPYLPCALFYLLALWAYLRAHPVDGRLRPGWLAASMAMFVAALLSKAPAVSLPAVLLIFDIWLLGRLPGAPWTWWRRNSLAVLAEKLAFAALAVPFAVAAVAAKMSVAAPEALAMEVMLRDVVRNLPESLWFYPFKTVLPVYLSPYYSVASPARGTGLLRLLAPWATVVVAVLMLLRPRSPVTGMVLAYLAILAPSLGMIQYSMQVAADRYVFVPTLVVVVMICGVRWRLRLPTAWPRAWQVARSGALAAAVLAVALFSAQSRGYAAVWKDSITLWEHAVALGAGRSATVVSGLGQAYLQAGRIDDAVRAYAHVVTLQPRRAQAHRNYGVAQLHAGRLDEAERHFRIAVGLNPRLPNLMFNLGEVFWRQDKASEALAALAMDLSANPGNQIGRALIVEIMMHTQDLDPKLVTAVREVLGQR